MKSSDPFAAALHAWVHVFMRHSMHNFMRYSRESGFSIPQLSLLLHVHRESCIGVSSLGDLLGVTSAAVSQLLERLVQQELITRTEDPNDRRAKQITLTEKGRQVIQESMHARQGWLDELSEVLSNSEKEQVIAALKILTEKTRLLEPLPDTGNNPTM